MSAALAKLWAKQYFGVSDLIRGQYSSLFIIDKGTVTAYLSENAARLAESYSSAYWKPGFRAEYLNESEGRRNTMSRFYADFQAADVKSADNEQLAKWLAAYERCFVPLTVCFNQSQEEFTQKPYLHLREKLVEKGCRNVDEVVSHLLAPDRADVLVREEQAMIQYALNGCTRNELFRHSIEYALLFYNSYDVESNLKFLENRIENLKASGKKSLERQAKDAREKCLDVDRFQKEWNRQWHDEELAELAFLLRDLGMDRLELKNAWAGAEYRFLDLFKEVSRRIEVPFKGLMKCCTIDDMKAALDGRPIDFRQLGKHREFYAYYSHDGHVKEMDADKVEGFLRKNIPDCFEAGNVRQLVGNSANPGKIQGEAYVVQNAGIEELLKDSEQFKPGSILVTSMTQPNMLLLAKKAAGIVTDEGGITSHAAIISRELKIPCVVGTRHATQAIRTGDWLELDSDSTRGTVIIRKPNA